jgi:hypothetical protein
MCHRLVLGLCAVVVGLPAVGCSNKNNRGGQGGEIGDAQAGTGGVTAVVNSVYQRNNHPSRDGHFVQPALTKTAAATLAIDTTFAGNYTGSTWASPLYLENGPAGKGVFIVVTNGNDVFALDETTGSIVWTRNIGTPPGRSGAGCGDIFPIGIISTPVIDPQTRTIYVAGAIGTTTTITTHQIHALSPEDGSERAGWPVDVNGITSGTTTFTAPPQNQRSALSLVGGILYVAYGGHNGDCGNYRGWGGAPPVAWPPMATGSSRSPATISPGRRPTPTAKRSCASPGSAPSIAAPRTASSTRRAGWGWIGSTPTSAPAARSTSRSRHRWWRRCRRTGTST